MKPHFKAFKREELKHIFQKIGSEARLEDILKKFYNRMSEDILLMHFFIGKDLDAIARKQKEFLLKAMGVISSYNGKAPAEAHSQIPSILQGHFDRRLMILREVLQEYGLAPAIVDLWMQFENAFRDSIVVE